MVDADWLLLATAWQHCQSAGAPSLAFRDILQSGRVPLRPGHFRAAPFEHLLPQLTHVWILPELNVISMELDSSAAQREIAKELARSLGGPPKTVYENELTSYWKFGEVRVHWRELADELAAAGFDVADTSDHVGSKRRLAYKGELVSFMQQLGQKMLAVLTDDEIAGRFRARIEARKQAGQSALPLPQLRHIANQVAKLRPRVVART